MKSNTINCKKCGKVVGTKVPLLTEINKHSITIYDEKEFGGYRLAQGKGFVPCCIDCYKGDIK